VFTGRLAMLPISVAPHSRLYVLALYPQITEDFKGIENNSDEILIFPSDWPKTNAQLFKSGRFGDLANAYRYEITNPNDAMLLQIVMAFGLTFRKPKAKGGSSASDPVFASRQHWIEIAKLKAQDTFTFYLINESPLYVEVQFPDRATAEVAGNTRRSVVEITQVGTNIMERMCRWTFWPSTSQWSGVP
jgi:hypothetical protein